MSDSGTDTQRDTGDKSIRVDGGKLVINDEVEVTLYLHDPEGEPTPLADSEELRIQHPADGLFDGQPCGIYSLEGRPEDRPAVSVQIDGYDPNGGSDE